MYFPFKKADGFIAKLLVLSLFPLWAIWVGWRSKIDLVIAFGFLYAFIQGFSKCLLKRPMVTLIRGSLVFGFKTQNLSKYFLYLNKLIEGLGLYFSDRIITNNSAARREVSRILRKRKNRDIQILHNNIPPIKTLEPQDTSTIRAKYGLPEDAKVLVTAGIINRGKNIAILIKSLSKIRIKHLYLLVVGDGSTEADKSYKHSLQELTRKMGVDKQVLFPGWLEKEELWKIYTASDLFVLPSLSEGMPNAMLEALGAGLACVGSNIDGVKDILQYDELLFDPLDEKHLTEKILRVFSDSLLFERIKRLCQERKKVFEFDWKEKIFQMVTTGFDHMHRQLSCMTTNGSENDYE